MTTNYLRLAFLMYEDLKWNIKCRYNFWLYGPYGLSAVVESIPSRFVNKYLVKYGATIGKDVRIERGINIHRPDPDRPFKNLFIGNHSYLGHKIKLDLTRKVMIHNHVIIGSRCMFWTHSSYYEYPEQSQPVYYEKYGEIEIREYALVYSDVILSPGVTIGGHSRIGANSLVLKDVEDFAFYGGSPAKLISKSPSNL